ncbi:MAG: hypothetical protein MI861_22325, partial [Pirellulales bacterium]|nr:hypothetical protein [Pirellulales bacterium]
MHDALFDRIQPVTRRLRSVRFWRIVALSALVAGMVGLAAYLQREQVRWAGPNVALGLSSIALACVITAMVIARLSFRNPRQVANRIETQFPSLQQRLLTALSQQREDADLGYLQRRVIQEARDHSRAHQWTDVVPAGRLLLSRLSGLSATAFLAVILVLLGVSGWNAENNSASSTSPRRPKVVIEPGNTEIERGNSLVITARVAGAAGDRVPDGAQLVCTAADGAERRITMTQNLDDPVLGGFVASVDQPFTYRVETAGWQSESYSVDVFEFPMLVRADAQLTFPQYTGRKEKRVEDTMRVSAVEGTEVTWICFLNKAVASAELVAKDGARLALEPDPRWPGSYATKIELKQSQRLTLELLDAANRKNKYPPELVMRALPNQPPKLKLTAARDMSVSPLEELSVGVEVRDDFGVVAAGLSYTFAMNPSREIKLASSIPRGATERLDHLIELESLDAEPDQLLAYHFWVEDYGPDGQLRRTESDLFFAEVRPFE